MYKDEDIEKFLSKLDIVQVIGEYVTLKKSGANYKGFSPFKEERTPSFMVSPTKKIFKDFSTGIAGNTISFYMKMNNLNFVESIEELSRKYNIPIKKLNVNTNKISKYEKYYEIMKEAQLFFSRNIFESEEALNYMRNRGYSEEELKKFGIGYSPNEWNSLENYLTEKGYEENVLIELGLLRKNENGRVFDYFRNRIMFPIYNESMRIVGFGGRIIESDDNLPKYLNSPDSLIFKKGNELFGLNRGEDIRKKDYTILMEGYLDVLTAHKNSFLNSVASLGTSFTEEQAKLLKKYTSNIIIAYDSDEAGIDAITKAGNILKKHDFKVNCLLVKDAKDPDEYLKKYGRKNFLELLKTSKDFFQFLYDEFLKDINFNTILGKTELIKKFKPFFKNLVNKTEADLYLNKLSVELEIDKKVLSNELIPQTNFLNSYYNSKKSFYKKNNIEIERVKNKKVNTELYDILERDTLEFILKYNNSSSEEYKEYCKILKNKKIKNIIYKKIFEKLKKINFENNDYLENDIFEDEEKELISTLLFNVSIENSDEKIKKFYNDTFKAWFLREIKQIIENISRTDDKYKILKTIESELKINHNIEKIKDMYKQFNLIRSSDYV